MKALQMKIKLYDLIGNFNHDNYVELIIIIVIITRKLIIIRASFRGAP